MQRIVNFRIICLAGLLAMIMGSCRHKGPETDDFDRMLYKPEYAGGFEIRGNGDMKSTMLTVYNPWQGADSVTTRLFIARDGESAPEGFDGQVLEGDARRIIAMSSTNVAMLDALDATDAIVGVSGIQFISNDSIQAHRDKVGDVGFDGNINYEVLLSLEPDIVLLYGVNGSSAMETKLKELGIPFMYVGDYLEESPLGKAEWLVAISEIIGCRDKGIALFNEIPVRYNALKDSVAGSGLQHPTVMINTPYNDSWFMPSVKSYAIQLLQDAGADYIYNKNTGNESKVIDTEEAYLLASTADVWIHPGTANSLDELKSMIPKFADTPSVRNGQVYNNNLRSSAGGGNDYFESAVVHPDLVLRDLIKIFHPELVQENFVYYKQLK